MLHHSNVDRLIAMWQAIYYNDSTMSTTSQSHGFFGSLPGNVTADSPLKPFFDANLNYHTSKTASQTKTFGYTYPEINDWSKTPEQLRTYVINRVNTLYGQGTEKAPKQSVGRRRSAAAPSISYTAEIRVERSEVPLPCSIDVRLGEHTLGTMTLLGMPMKGMAYSSVPLRDALLKLNLKNMPDNALVPYLQKNLRVEVRKVCTLSWCPMTKTQGLGCWLTQSRTAMFWHRIMRRASRLSYRDRTLYRGLVTISCPSMERRGGGRLASASRPPSQQDT